MLRDRRRQECSILERAEPVVRPLLDAWRVDTAHRVRYENAVCIAQQVEALHPPVEGSERVHTISVRRLRRKSSARAKESAAPLCKMSVYIAGSDGHETLPGLLEEFPGGP